MSNGRDQDFVTMHLAGNRFHHLSKRAGLYTLLLMLSACGGSSDSDEVVVVPPPLPPVSLTTEQLNQASKFSSRATFGLEFHEIEDLARLGESDWLNAEFAKPIQRHSVFVDELIARRDAGEFTDYEVDIGFLIRFRRFAWWHCAVHCDDALRQRVAFALSQIFVISDNVDQLFINPYATSDYYDMLLSHAFGNFRELLSAVARHPSMGIYLSHVNNAKADPVANTFPDENFAREVMQLFSIGLFELNIDGTHVPDGNGDPIPTYDNEDIREFAKIFTGFSYGADNPFFGRVTPWFRDPMVMFDEFHEPGQKNLLNGVVVPAGQSGMQDFEQAIDNLFNHPNVGPFIGKQLIQRLVTSNPSPAYIERVARTFNGDATGVRGDMQEVLRAILTDPEAQNPTGNTVGKLREPVERYVAMLRQLRATTSDGFLPNSAHFFSALTRQHPLSAPSVFNFYLPTHSPNGALADANLVAPEFEITNSSTIINMSNFVDLVLNFNYVTDVPEPFEAAVLDLSEFLELADDIDTLLDRLDIVFTYGTLSAETRATIEALAGSLPEADSRVKIALYMLLTSPDYAVRF